MTDEAAFQAHLDANPDDDTARGAYADWLQDRAGDPVWVPCPDCHRYAADPENLFGAPGHRPERDPASGRHEGGWTNCKTCNGGALGNPGFVKGKCDRPDRAFYQRARVAVKPVLADPDDDAARLAFADWCDAQGRIDRAALIRDQIALAGKPPCPDWCDHDPAKCRVTWLEKAIPGHLDAARKDVWCGHPQLELMAHRYGASSIAAAGTWRRGCVYRGFVERVYATGPAWVEHAAHLLAHNPVTHAFLEHLPPVGFGGLVAAGGVETSRYCWFVRHDGAKMPAHLLPHTRFPDVALGRIAAKLAALYWPSVAATFRE